ncbi:MAG: hypothetical protein B6226_01470 [Candidatus Cloacimonetes bacterium 4572_65]|nr:MAG: hypothetical protein B6226_01470 [Candidatus Cloacimonetes bacterium 4572_65]
MSKIEVIEYFEGTGLHLGKKTGGKDSKIIVENGSKKKSKLSVARVLFSHVFTVDESSDTLIKQTEAKIDSFKDDFDIMELWEIALDEIREYDVDELLSFYSDDSSSFQKSALYRYIREENLHFKRKGTNFLPRTEEQITEITVQREKEEEKRRAILYLSDNLNKAIRGDSSTDEQIFPQLKKWLKQPTEELLSELIIKLANGQDEKTFVYNILHKNNQIDNEAHKFAIIHGMDTQFKEDELEEAKNLVVDLDNRRDLTNLLTFTIDSEETKEIDDALSITFEEENIIVGIHITDVADSLPKDSVLDTLGYKRLSTLYLETGEITMFPTDVCYDKLSLVKGENRPSISALFTFSPTYELLDKEICLSVINVDEKISYNEVDKSLRKKGDYYNELNTLRNISQKVKELRFENGAIEINRPEVQIDVDGDEINLKIIKRLSPSRSMISEFMILMNSSTAQFANDNDIPFIFRVQDEPDADYKHFLSLDYYDPVLNDKLIRLIRPSRISTEAYQHHGLGVDSYAQTTSPLRRYNDLVMQRQIASFLRKEEFKYNHEELLWYVAYCEEKDKSRRDMYNQSSTYWFLRYLEKHMMYEPMEAVVVNEQNKNITCEILRFGKRYSVRNIYQNMVGDIVNLLIDKVDPEKGFVKLSLMND